jgi:glycerol kinase
MPAGLILAIDQGTTNTKGVLVGRSGAPVFRTSSPVSMIVTAQDFVEQDLFHLRESMLKVIAECRSFASQSGDAIEALAISNQRETAAAWNAETGEPAGHAVGWQCGRSVEICNLLAARAEVIRSRTGLPLAPLISAGKWRWMLENDASVQSLAARGTLKLGTIDSWLIYRLTQGAVHVTDLTNASRTGLLNLGTLQWDRDLLELFGIPFEAMPALHSSCGFFGHCAAIAGLEGVPVLAAIGDSHAAMFGHGHYSAGSVKATYGTGSSLMALTPSLLAEAPVLARTVAWSIKGETQFALEGNIAMSGSALQWVGNFLGLPDPAADSASLAASVSDASGVHFVPAMVGLGAPHWDADARGTICGLGPAHTAAHLARAAVDAIAYQVADVFFAIEAACGLKISALLADGGATRNDRLMQFQADILGCPVLRSSNEELSALGAAWLAGLALGWWKSPAELQAMPHPTDEFVPQIDQAERNRRYRGWKSAVHRARFRQEGHA